MNGTGIAQKSMLLMLVVDHMSGSWLCQPNIDRRNVSRPDVFRPKEQSIPDTNLSCSSMRIFTKFLEKTLKINYKKGCLIFRVMISFKVCLRWLRHHLPFLWNVELFSRWPPSGKDINSGANVIKLFTDLIYEWAK